MRTPAQQQDAAILWHPYTQQKTAGNNIVITKAEGAYLYAENGDRYIDAVSSWWVTLHGHAQPTIAAAIAAQAQQLEQVIFAGFTHATAIALAEKLLQRAPYLHRVFYSDNGSTAVEAAVKMALQYWRNQGEQRTTIICLRDAYHGDTFGAMSVSARGVFTEPFQRLLFDVIFIDTPIAGNEERALQQLNDALLQRPAAFICEPLVLGSAGMLMYSAEVMNALFTRCKQAGVLIIADEVFTGFGRTGRFFATDYIVTKPDIMCLSKGITGGFLPFAATLTTDNVYTAFHADEKTKMLFHGHSYTGNPLGCAAALASLQVFEQENTLQKIAHITSQHAAAAITLRQKHNVREVRQTGTILAIEFKSDERTGYLHSLRDILYHYFLERKILLRPLGNIVYVLPPYCISDHDLQEVYAALLNFNS